MKPPQTKLTVLLIAFLLAATFLIVFYQNSSSNVSARPVRVACVGDSITEWSNYTGILQDMLGEEYVVENFGVASSTVLQNTEKPYIEEPEFGQGIDFEPDVVVIMLGTNDAKDYNYVNIDSFPADYIQLITAYAALPKNEQIWLVTPPPIYENDLGLNNTNLEEGVIPSIEVVAENLDLPTIDVYNVLANHSDCFVDGVHPNSDGAELIASTINDAISQGNTEYNGFNYWDN